MSRRPPQSTMRSMSRRSSPMMSPSDVKLEMASDLNSEILSNEIDARKSIARAESLIEEQEALLRSANVAPVYIKPSVASDAATSEVVYSSWANLFIWFFLCFFVTWLVLFTLRPSWVRVAGSNTKNEIDQIDYPKLLWISALIALAVLVLIYLIQRCWQ
jgi:hypothetical protein